MRDNGLINTRWSEAQQDKVLSKLVKVIHGFIVNIIHWIAYQLQQDPNTQVVKKDTKFNMTIQNTGQICTCFVPSY